MTDERYHRPLSPREVKDLLSEEEFGQAKEKVERAERVLEEVKAVLSSALFLHNGKLSTGTIDYAAFRIETLSLIFEVAARTFRRTAKSGVTAYQDFLEDLGDEVGFTFARGLLDRVSRGGFLLDVQSISTLLELWTLFENDTGAGTTKLVSCEPEGVVILLVNNPLRRAESSPHAHCGFYCHYIMSLLNELHTSRARLIQQRITGVKATARKVVDVVHQSDANDNCAFRAELRPEMLTRAFDALCVAYDLFYGLQEDADFSPCTTYMRNALVFAQEETVRLKGEQAPRQLYKVFRRVLDRGDYSRMKEVYQRVSNAVHTSAKLTRARCWTMLRDIRRSIYALELLDISEEERSNLAKMARIAERAAILEELVNGTEGLSAEEKRETLQLVSKLINNDLVEENQQARLLEFLKKLGGQVWDVGKGILAEVVASALMKQYES